MQRTRLIDMLLLLRKERQKPGQMPIPVHPDVVDLAEVLEHRLQAIERGER